jgi:multidrug efflux pump subunit AcrB
MVMLGSVVSSRISPVPTASRATISIRRPSCRANAARHQFGDRDRHHEEAGGETLPSGFSFEWTDLSYQQVTGGNAGLYVFPICVLFVFLVLAAQYGSWSLPFAVILIVPMCLLAATIGVRIMGQDVNILTQIGFVVLVGLAARTRS